MATTGRYDARRWCTRQQQRQRRQRDDENTKAAGRRSQQAARRRPGEQTRLPHHTPGELCAAAHAGQMPPLLCARCSAPLPQRHVPPPPPQRALRCVHEPPPALLARHLTTHTTPLSTPPTRHPQAITYKQAQDASVNDLAHASVNDDAAGGSNAGSSESGMVSLLRGGDAARSNEAAGGSNAGSSESGMVSLLHGGDAASVCESDDDGSVHTPASSSLDPQVQEALALALSAAGSCWWRRCGGRAQLELRFVQLLELRFSDGVPQVRGWQRQSKQAAARRWRKNVRLLGAVS